MCSNDDCDTDNALDRDIPMDMEWPISLHSSLPANTSTYMMAMAVNGLPMVAGAEMGIAAVRGLRWIDWKCMYLQMGDYFRALGVQQEEQEEEKEVSTTVIAQMSEFRAERIQYALHVC